MSLDNKKSFWNPYFYWGSSGLVSRNAFLERVLERPRVPKGGLLQSLASTEERPQTLVYQGFQRLQVCDEEHLDRPFGTCRVLY